ncbi:MAG: SprT family zinc-dependent metalloprotease [Bacteroidales bacterium]
MFGQEKETEKIYYLREVGEIKAIKSKRARRLSIRVKPFDGVVVTLPFKASFKMAENFIEEKKSWIISSLLKTSKYEERLSVFTENSGFKTRSHELVIEKWNKNTISVRVLNGKIMVKYPEKELVRDESIQSSIRKGIERALLIEALDYLPERTALLAKLKGFRFKSVSIKNSKSRWGCCTRDNHIQLNLHLMRLTQSLIDYVIMHELCHTIQKNHSKKFWDLMEKVFPGALQCNKELKNFQIKIY